VTPAPQPAPQVAPSPIPALVGPTPAETAQAIACRLLPRSGDTLTFDTFCTQAMLAAQALNLDKQTDIDVVALTWKIDTLYPELFHVTDTRDLRMIARR
jgi:hypothetical protein